jgi:hypothetical protein
MLAMSDVERELRWAREALQLAEKYGGKPAFADGKDEILVGQIRQAGFHHLTRMNEMRLEEHIDRLERDKISMHSDE